MSKFKNVKDQLALGLTQNSNLKEIPEQIGNQGGSHVQLMDHTARNANRAGTLSDMMTKIAENRKLQALSKMAKSTGGKKAMAAIAGPIGIALSTAEDAMASDNLGGGSEHDAMMRENDEHNRRQNAMKIASPEQEQALGQVYQNIDSGQPNPLLSSPEEILRFKKLREMIGG